MGLRGRILLLGAAAIALIAVLGMVSFQWASRDGGVRESTRVSWAELRAYLRLSETAQQLRWALAGFAVAEPVDQLHRQLDGELGALHVLVRTGGSPTEGLGELMAASRDLDGALATNGAGGQARAILEQIEALAQEGAERRMVALRAIDEDDLADAAFSARRAVAFPLVAAAAVGLLVLLALRRRADMEALVAVRTAELEASRAELERNLRHLRETRERLASADRLRLVGTLAAGVAHEINNPLAYLIGNLDYVERHPPSESTVLALADARQGAERIRQIVKDLVSFCAPDEARGPLDVGAVLDDAIKMAAHELRPFRLVRELDAVPFVEANRGQLGQVFLNLLVNAAQALQGSETGEIRVSLRCDATGDVVIEVEDRGCGIEPEIRERIFDPFFTTRPVGQGTGLGLSICSGIVNAHGGAIELVPGEREGSLFRVTLPAIRAEAAA